MMLDLSSFPLGDYSREFYDKYLRKRKLSLDAPLIHVVGSNGKSITASMISHIYEKAGYKVGLFLSSSSLGLSGMVQINNLPVDEAKLGKLLQENEKDFHKFGLTRFEVEVVLAYLYFNQEKPDLVIVEAGMGGALDATNIEGADTRLVVMTSCSLEHTAYLGTTVSQIAYQKGLVLKDGSKLLLPLLDEETEGVLRNLAKEFDAPVSKVDNFHFPHLDANGFHFDYGSYKDIVMPVEALYSLFDASLAIEAVGLLKEDFPVSEEAVRDGLNYPLPEGRFERFGRIVLDAACNPEAAKMIASRTQTIGKGKPVHVLFASTREKNIAVVLPSLANAVADITLTRYEGENVRDETDYFLYIGDHSYEDDFKQALEKLLNDYPEDAVLITGSLEFTYCAKKYIEEKKLG